MINDNFLNSLQKTEKTIQKMFSSDVFFSNFIEKENYLTQLKDIKFKLSEMLHVNYNTIRNNELTPDIILTFFNNISEDIKEIKNDIISKYPNEKWLNVQVSILNNLPVYFMDAFIKNIEKESTPTLKTNIFKKFTNLNLLLKDTVKNIYQQQTIHDETYKQLVEEKSTQIISQFNLESIHFIDSKTWKQKFEILQEVFNSIQLTHSKVGIPTDNLGFGKLNLVISDDFLSSNNWEGFQSDTNNSSSIFINSSGIDLNKTWMHEYTHFLDKEAGKKYNLENPNTDNIDCYSHIALKNINNIQDKNLKIMAETMAASLAGVTTEEFNKEISNRLSLVKDNLSLMLILESLPDSKTTWNSFSDEIKNEILSNNVIKNIPDFIMDDIKNIDIEQYSSNLSKTLSDITHLKINENKLNSYIKEQLNFDILEIMSSYKLDLYKDIKNNNEKFLFFTDNEISNIAKTFQDQQKDFKCPYFDKPLELFARMTEGLQSNLLINYDYEKNIKNKISSVPILGKEERFVVCSALHNLASYVGLKVPSCDFELLPCNIPEFIDHIVTMDKTNEIKFATPNQVILNNDQKKNILHNIEKIRQDFLYQNQSCSIKLKK